MAIIDLQKKIGEAENKFKQQQNLYEAVRVDRNMYSKKLIESQDEIQEMKRKFKIMNHQIEQLKDEISAKDMALVKEHFDHLRVRSCTTPNTSGMTWHEVHSLGHCKKQFSWSLLRSGAAICLSEQAELAVLEAALLCFGKVAVVYT